MLSPVFRWIGFVAICFVVTIHLPRCCGWVEQYIVRGIAQLAVPWFFFAAGFWFVGQRKGPIGIQERYRFLVSRVHTLLLPYLLANALWFAFMVMVEFVGVRWLGVAPSRFSLSVGNVLAAFGLFPHVLPALVPTWFLRALMLFTLVAWVLQGLGRWCVGVMMTSAASVLVLSVCCPVSEPYLTFTFPPMGFVAYVSGYVLRSGIEKWRGGVVLQSQRWFGVWEILLRNTFPIFLLHVPVLLTSIYVFRALGIVARDSWMANYEAWAGTKVGFFVLWPVVTLLALVWAEVLRRFLPRFSALIFGKR